MLSSLIMRPLNQYFQLIKCYVRNGVLNCGKSPAISYELKILFIVNGDEKRFFACSLETVSASVKKVVYRFVDNKS